jgi:hypothetical protein
VADDPFTPDDDLPARHHPIRNLPWLDVTTEHEVFQHRAGQSARLAEWCGGEVAFVDDLIVRVPTAPGVHAHARLGDFVLFDGQRYWVEQADGFFQRFWPVGKDPGFAHHCRMPWEAP